MIIGRELMVQLGLSSEFKRQVLQWDGIIVPMKEHISPLGKSDLTSRKIHEMVMKTA